MVDKIPPVVSADAEDVAWALQTADALWNRGERVDAIVWVRRAAQAAGAAENEERALELARDAADLSEYLAEQNVSNRRTISDHPSAQADIDDLLASAPNEPLYYTPAPPLPPGHPDDSEDVVTSAPPLRMPLPMPIPRGALQSDEIDDLLVTAANPVASDAPIALSSLPPMSMDELDVLSIPPPPVAPPPPSSAMRAPPPLPPSGPRMPAPPPLPRGVPVPPADLSSAGGAASSAAPPATSRPLPPARHAPPPRFTVGRPSTSAGGTGMPASPPQAAAPPPLAAPPAPPRSTSPSSSSMSIASPAHAHPVSRLPTPGVERGGGFPERGDRGPAPLPPAALPPPRRLDRPSEIEPVPLPPRSVHPPQATMPDTFFPPATPPPPPLQVAPPPFVPVLPPPQPRLELRDLEAFLLLDGPQRDDLGRTAQVSSLAPNDEVTGFALALVLKGQVNVAATVAEAPAMRASPGELVRSGGTATDQVKIRLVPVGEDVEIATWTDEDVSRVLASAPAFATQLGELADHIQVRVGVALGPLGERLDFALRTEIVDRLETRHLKEGDVVVAAGKPVPGMIVVGAGSLELIDGTTTMQDVNPGEFLFAEAILGGGPAPHTARAGRGGATILFGGRLLAQELLVTCPPLLELFAGM
jgi:hypothetical protein